MAGCRLLAQRALHAVDARRVELVDPVVFLRLRRLLSRVVCQQQGRLAQRVHGPGEVALVVDRLDCLQVSLACLAGARSSNSLRKLGLARAHLPRVAKLARLALVKVALALQHHFGLGGLRVIFLRLLSGRRVLMVLRHVYERGLLLLRFDLC